MIKREEKNNYKYLNYIKNDKVVGFIEYQISLDELSITNIFVNEEERRKKIASKLLSELFKEKVGKVFLEVNVNNISAIKLYRKFDFITINIRRNYYNQKDDAYIMVRMLKDVYILGIESSCDETSISIVKNGKVDISTTINTQIPVHKKYGGVVPELASRLHLENITIVLEETLKKANMKLEDMDAFACTYGPGLLGSLLVGLEAAKTLSFIYKKPLIKVNHMMGHIYANKIESDFNFPLLALVISGGHTDLIRMNSDLEFDYISQTLDDAIGECFDKVARILDIPYPGGPNLEKLASNGECNYKMPKLIKDKTTNFSFSGIKSYVNNLVHNEKQRKHNINKEDLACSFQTSVTDSLVDKTRLALKENNINQIIVAGGVSSNSYIRNRLYNLANEENVNIIMPDKKYCTDNATMIAAAAYPLFLKKDFASFDIDAKSNLQLKSE